MIYPTTIPNNWLHTFPYRDGFGTVLDTSDGETLQIGDVFTYKLRSDGVAVVRWEAPKHMATDYWLTEDQVREQVAR